jgi:chemotaxis protein CheC
MILNAGQQDALSELVNMGFGRAAHALSILVGRRVLLEAPQVDIFPLNLIEEALGYLSNREITTVHQVFNGKLTGDIMLLLDAESASVLLDLLEGRPGEAHRLTKEDRDTLVETGNIFLNAFIGAFGNLLNVYITFAVPHLRIESIRQMLHTLSIGQKEVEYALVAKVRFRLDVGEVSGYVVIVMSLASLETVFEAMKTEGYLL